jgi:hypothetical protein
MDTPLREGDSLYWKGFVDMEMKLAGWGRLREI